MLRVLHIENIAVVEKADITFGPGLNVLTGETGAGKSIVIDAIGAVLGGRVSKDLIRTGAAGASVTAVFSDVNVSDWCEETGVDVDDELFIMRKISADGKSTCRVCGVPVSAGQLRTLGDRLLDIHGQHDGQLLMTEANHLKYLDSFGGYPDVRAQYASAYGVWKDAAERRAALLEMESEKERRTDILKYEISELESASLRAGEALELTSRRDLLKNAGKISDAVNTAFEALYGGLGEGAVDLIAQAEAGVTEAMTYAAEMTDLGSRITDLRYAAEDIAEGLRDVRERLEFSPEAFDQLEERLSLLHRLFRKYGGEEEALNYLERAKEELDDITFAAQKLEKLDRELEEHAKALRSAGKALTRARKAAGEGLRTRIVAELAGLSMPGIQFAVAFTSKKEYDATGGDEVQFLMSANTGEKLGRISKVASGGELARIMLAMKNVLAASEDIGTMVFDEVDTGVSGIAAQRVGEKLADLGRIRQVLCVTHLSQIAALADIHFVIEKDVRDGRTFTEITELDRAGRQRELARLIGGEHVTELTLRSAGELLDSAAGYKCK